MTHTRAVHLNYQHCHQEEPQNTELASRLLFLFVSYMFLLVFIYFFFKKCVRLQVQKYDIDPLPDANVLGYVYGGVMLLMGGIGVYCVIEDPWTTNAWIYYFLSNVLIAVLIYVYQTDKQYTLFSATLFAIMLSIFLELLFMETSQMEKGKPRLIVRNIVGAVQAWSMVYTLIALGQWAVHDLQMSKHCQSILFFILTIAVTIILALWNRQQGYGRWNKQYGFCICASMLVFISVIRACDREEDHSF